MQKLKDLIDKVISAICVVIFCGLIVTVMWQVITRFILKNPSATSEEFAKILFVWIVLFAATLLVGEKGHLNITFIKDKFKGKKGIYLDILSEVIMLVFAVIVLVNGGVSIVTNAITQTNATIPWLKIGQIYAVIPICGVLMVFYNVYWIVEGFKALKSLSNQKIGGI